MRRFLFLLCLWSIIAAPAYAASLPDYYAAPTDQEKADIRFIILTLSNKSGLSLLFERSALEQAGSRTRDVHPLRFLCYVFTDPQLRSAIGRIQGIAWNRFSKDMGDSLARQAANANLTPEILSDFSKQIGFVEPKLSPNATGSDWQRFIQAARASARNN